MKRGVYGAFFLISIIHLIGIFFNMSLIGAITKPMIMLILLGYYVLAVSQRSKLFIAALLFCWLGDVLLMFQEAEMYFILGLVAFLTGHILYIFCYRFFRWSQATQPLLSTQKIRFSLPILLAGTGLVTVLYPYLGGLRIPVMIYALVITVMTLQALFRYGFSSRRSFSMVMIGALLFMLSDSLLAVNKFMHPFPFASVSIMVTYIAAQFFIVEGVIAHQKEQ